MPELSPAVTDLPEQEMRKQHIKRTGTSVFQPFLSFIIGFPNSVVQKYYLYCANSMSFAALAASFSLFSTFARFAFTASASPLRAAMIAFRYDE